MEIKERKIFDIGVKIDGAMYNFSVAAESEAEAKKQLVAILGKLIEELKA